MPIRLIAPHVYIETDFIRPVSALHSPLQRPPRSPDPLAPPLTTSSRSAWDKGETRTHAQLLSLSNHCPLSLPGADVTPAGTSPPGQEADVTLSPECPASAARPLATLPSTLPRPKAYLPRAGGVIGPFNQPASHGPRLQQGEYDVECEFSITRSSTAPCFDGPNVVTVHDAMLGGGHEGCEGQPLGEGHVSLFSEQKYHSHKGRLERVTGEAVEGAVGHGEGEAPVEDCHVAVARSTTAPRAGSQQAERIRRRVPRSPSGGHSGSFSPCSPDTPDSLKASAILSPLGPRRRSRRSSAVQETSPAGSPGRIQHNRSLSGVPANSLDSSPLHPLRQYRTSSGVPHMPSPSSSPHRALPYRTSSCMAHSQYPASSPFRGSISCVASPISTLSTGWVDPNELHIDLTKLRRHRTNSTVASSNGDGSPTGDSNSGAVRRDKMAERAERHRRIKNLLKGLSHEHSDRGESGAHEGGVSRSHSNAAELDH